MEFMWQQELTTYGKTIRGCIRNDLLSPRASAVFYHFGHYLHKGIRRGASLNGLGRVLMSEFGGGEQKKKKNLMKGLSGVEKQNQTQWASNV